MFVQFIILLKSKIAYFIITLHILLNKLEISPL